MNFNFISKAAYLESRAAWKVEYAALTIKARADKVALNTAMRKHEQDYTHHRALRENKASATAALEQLAAAKIESARLAEAARG